MTHCFIEDRLCGIVSVAYVSYCWNIATCTEIVWRHEEHWRHEQCIGSCAQMIQVCRLCFERFYFVVISTSVWRQWRCSNKILMWQSKPVPQSMPQCSDSSSHCTTLWKEKKMPMLKKKKKHAWEVSFCCHSLLTHLAEVRNLANAQKAENAPLLRVRNGYMCTKVHRATWTSGVQ